MMSRYLKYISVIFAFLGVGASSFLHAQVPVITSSLGEFAVVGTPYTYTINASNTPIIGYADANLPVWLSRTGNSISGTPAVTDVGATSFDVAALNSDGLSEFTTVDLLVYPTNSTPFRVSVGTSAGSLDVPFSYQVPFQNTPTQVSVYGLDAFTGLSYTTDSANLTISGTPRVLRSATVFIVAENDFGSDLLELSLEISEGPVINSALAHSGQMNAAIVPYQITTAGSAISYSASGLELIPGLGLSGDGIISGTPEVFGIFDVVLNAANTTGSSPSRSLTLTINKEDGSAPVPEITSPFSALVETGPFSYQITADGNPTSYSAVGLPDGVSIDSVTGQILGAISGSIGTIYSVQISASNAAGTDEQQLVLRVTSGARPTLSLISPANGSAFNAGDLVTIDVTAEDADGQVTAVEFYDLSSFDLDTGDFDPPPPSPPTLYATGSKIDDTTWRLTVQTSLTDVGLIELFARAIDDRGNYSISPLSTVVGATGDISELESIFFSVVTGAVPTVAISSPIDGASFTAGDVIAIDVTAADIDGQVTAVNIFDGATGSLVGQANPTGVVGQYQLNYATSLAQAGQILNIEAQATDNSGNVAISEPTQVIVTANAVPQVEVTSPVSGSELLLGESLLIQMTASDADDGIAGFRCIQVGKYPLF